MRHGDHVPLEWWGPLGARGPALTIVDLVGGGVVSAWQAAWLWSAVAAGDSVCIAAGPSGAGKTTTLTSLVAAIPEGRKRIYPRGMYETFAFRREVQPDEATLLVNEISPHLPIYCWGDTARGVLQCAHDGFQVLATIHAITITELVHSLAARPSHLPPALIAALGVVVFLDAWRAADGRIERRVREIVRLQYEPASETIAVTTIAEGEGASDLVAWRAEVLARMAESLPGVSEAEIRGMLTRNA